MKRVTFLLLAALLAACADGDDGVLQGYGEADYIYLASQEAGVVAEVLVAEGDEVAAGEAIFRLDPNRLAFNAEGAAADRAAAAEEVQAASANAELTRRNYARSAELFERGFLPRARLDSDRAARDAADARLDQAQRRLGAAGAQTGLAEERVADLSGAAPRAGRIERIYHRPGEVVAAGAPIVALLAPENMKIRFFAPEGLLGRLSVGGQVQLACDGCAEGLTGRIIRIATEPQFTPPVIYDIEHRGKLLYLVEARPETAEAIRPGIPVDVRIAAE